MIKEFKNINVLYGETFEVSMNNKKYYIEGVLDNEDILVDFSNKYPILKDITKKSIERTDNGCIYQDRCGGCRFQNINYEYELKLKKAYLLDLFKNFKQKDIEIIPSYNFSHYRNKAIMTYKLSKNRNVVCGFYEEYSHRLVTVTNCLLQSEKANEIIEKINNVLSKNKILPYDEKSRSGIIRHIYIRNGFNTKEVMVVIVTNGELFPGRNNVIKDLNKLNLGITTIVQNYNSRDTSIVLGDKERILYGPGFIYEKVGDFKFKISSKSFFQVNTLGMKKLYDKAINMASITKNDIVIDAYCGVGTISIFASKYAKKVYGIELNKDAVLDAKINAKINNIANIDFICDDATNYMTHLAKFKEKIDIIIMDPPRDGSTKQFINAIGYLKPKKVIYISCNPETLKRDLYDFFNNNYVLDSISGVDMFPRTIHIECVAVLKLKK